MIIIVVHEWGHFIASRLCGVYVEEFAVGMGPKILSRVSKKGTIYSWRLFPIGGFCRMRGEEEAVDEEGSFSRASVWQRMAIVAAGPLMNFMLGMILVLFFTGMYGYVDTRIINVEEGYPAMEAGVEEGDRILEVNGQRVHIYSEFSYEMSFNQGETIEMKVRKADGSKETLMITPRYDEEQQRYRLGFAVGTNGGGIADIVREKGFGSFFPTLGRMIGHSFWALCYDVELVVHGVVQMVTGQVGMDQVAGPIGIVSVIGESYEAGIKESIMAAISNVASMVTLLSVNLGVLNLFPIPALDGSRLVFLVLEKIRGRKIPEKVENWIYVCGFLLLMGLMVLIAINDIRNLL